MIRCSYDTSYEDDGIYGFLVSGDDSSSFPGRRIHSQNMTVAARQMAEKKTVGHLS